MFNALRGPEIAENGDTDPPANEIPLSVDNILRASLVETQNLKGVMFA